MASYSLLFVNLASSLVKEGILIMLLQHLMGETYARIYSISTRGWQVVL